MCVYSPLQPHHMQSLFLDLNWRHSDECYIEPGRSLPGGDKKMQRDTRPVAPMDGTSQNWFSWCFDLICRGASPQSYFLSRFFSCLEQEKFGPQVTSETDHTHRWIYSLSSTIPPHMALRRLGSTHLPSSPIPIHLPHNRHKMKRRLWRSRARDDGVVN